MKKKKIIIVSGIAAVCILLLAAVFLPPAKLKEIGDRLETEEVYLEKKETLAASSIRPASVHEKGIFYIQDSRLNFYDYEQNESYVLCSKTQCDHSNEECGAYLGGKRLYGGYAMHQGKIYVISAESQDTGIELISMDVTGQNKKIVASLEGGSGALDEWTVSRIGDVYYDHGYAYLHLYLKKNQENNVQNGEQLMAIRLSDGEIYDLTGVIEMYTTEGVIVKFQLFTEKNVLYSVQVYDPVLPTYEEFLLENPNVDAEDGYEAYYNSFDPPTEPQTIRYYSFDPHGAEIKPEQEEELPLTKDYFGFEQRRSLVNFFGHNSGKWILSVTKDKENIYQGNRYILYDPATKEETLIMETNWVSNGPMGTGYGEVTNVMYDEDEILWINSVPENNQERQLSVFHTDTGTLEDLYVLDQADRDEQLDIRGITGKYVVVARREGMNALVYYVVDKDDFEETCLQNARKTPISHF